MTDARAPTNRPSLRTPRLPVWFLAVLPPYVPPHSRQLSRQLRHHKSNSRRPRSPTPSVLAESSNTFLAPPDLTVPVSCRMPSMECLKTRRISRRGIHYCISASLCCWPHPEPVAGTTWPVVSTRERWAINHKLLLGRGLRHAPAVMKLRLWLRPSGPR